MLAGFLVGKTETNTILVKPKIVYQVFTELPGRLETRSKEELNGLQQSKTT